MHHIAVSYWNSIGYLPSWRRRTDAMSAVSGQRRKVSDNHF